MMLNKLRMAVGMLLAIGALGIGASMLPHPTAAAEPLSPAAAPAVAKEADGNIKETVLALEKRTWEAYATQDAAAVKNLVADDFVCVDMFGEPTGKAGVLDYVARFRVVEHTMKDVKVVVLSPKCAILSYEVHYKVRPTEGGEVETTTRRVTSAWAQRKGRWWYVYFEDRLVPKEANFRKALGFDVEEGLSETIFMEVLKKRPSKD
jgi:ketosteroid isomerase-like protein